MSKDFLYYSLISALISASHLIPGLTVLHPDPVISSSIVEHSACKAYYARAEKMKGSHRKTRTGCTPCKQRRVKCDEEKPSCANCRRNFLECSLEFLIPSKPKSCTTQRTNTRKPSALQHPTLDFSLRGSSLDNKSFELLHHYTSCASLKFGQTSHVHVWQVDIPRMALSHDFLMHGVLAISALHLSTLQTSRKRELVRNAIFSENRALPDFRRLLSSQLPTDIHAVFAFSGFVVPYMLAVSRSFDASNSLPDSDAAQPHWFYSLKGVIALLTKTWGELSQGPFSPWLQRSDPVHSYDINPDDIHFAKVHEILRSTPSSSITDEEELETCRQALDELRKTAALPYSPCKTVNKVGATYIWPGSVPDHYMQLLHRRKPEALIILAHYCVQLKGVNACWYFEGVGKNMLRAVDEELSQEWKPWIKWALEQRES